MNPVLYGKEHLIYIAASLLIAFVVCFAAGKKLKTERSKIIYIKCAAAVLFLTIFLNRLALVFEYDQVNWLKLLTDSFCSTSSYVLSLSILFGNR